jgi:hypothetical protein
MRRRLEARTRNPQPRLENLMITTLRTTVTVLLLATAGIAQASEISESPTPASTRERIAVIAEARWAQPSNELYDGRDAKKPALSTKTREQVRMEAAASKAMQQQLALRDYLGGM